MTTAQKNKQEFDKQVKSKFFHIVGDFKNKFGEKFVMYHINGVVALFVTGDELDWELNWRYEKYDNKLTQEFALSSEEEDKLEALVSKFERPKS